MYRAKNRLSRVLSSFDHSSHRWVAIPLRDTNGSITQKPASAPADAHAISKQTLSLTSWNIQASYYTPVERCELILDHISKGPKASDIIFFQEVMPKVREALLSNPTVRSDFLTTDAEDDTSGLAQSILRCRIRLTGVWIRISFMKMRRRLIDFCRLRAIGVKLRVSMKSRS